MGLQDRDYMHERRERPFSPAPSREAPSWLIVLLIVTVVYATYRGYDRWLDTASESNLSVVSVPTAEAVRPPATMSAPDRAERSATPPPAWSRCDVDGKTVYTDAPCPAGTSRSAGTVATPLLDEPNKTLTLYHCKGYDGRTFWANSHCNQHRALVDRMVNVPANVSFEQQVALAEGQRPAVRQVTQPRMLTVSPSPNAVVGSQQYECDRLDAHVRYLDAMARQPQSGVVQDWIRGERQSARDRQFRLRC